jgi:hypothetical protein
MTILIMILLLTTLHVMILLKMILLITTLLVMTILRTLNTDKITYDDTTYN